VHFGRWRVPWGSGVDEQHSRLRASEHERAAESGSTCSDDDHVVVFLFGHFDHLHEYVFTRRGKSGISVAKTGTSCFDGPMSASQRVETELSQIAPRLRQARQKKDVTLEQLATSTGISKSTLSRLESGQRKPSLELLLPIVTALGVGLDEIVSSPKIDDPRVLQKSTRADGRILTPLSVHHGEPQTYKITIPATDRDPVLRTHDGYEWIYVLSGRLRLVLGEHDIVLGAGEAAEFDTKNPHWFGASGAGSVDVLSMFGKHGERIHLRARSVAATS
jgi:transcriptional regulator with XRE-family HTH domain